MAIIIEQNIKLPPQAAFPTKPKGELRLAMEKMGVGDSFEFPKGHGPRIRSATSSPWAKGKKFAVRGNRVWRTA